MTNEETANSKPKSNALLILQSLFRIVSPVEPLSQSHLYIVMFDCTISMNKPFPVFEKQSSKLFFGGCIAGQR
jgi:hypothetical protein